MERKAVVIGAGINGLCAARELRRRGWKVSVVDPQAVGNDRGSTFGTRNINIWWTLKRAELQHLGNKLWVDIERELSPGLLRRYSCVQLLPENKLEEYKRVNIKHNQPAEILSGSDLQKRFGLCIERPGLLLKDSCRCVLIHGVTSQLEQQLLSNGVDFVRSAVTRFDGHMVETTDTILSADLTVLASGQWMNELLARLGYNWKFNVTGQIYSIYGSDTVSFSPEHWILLEDEYGFDGVEYYSMPDLQTNGLLKVAVDGIGPTVRPGEQRSCTDELAGVDSYVQSVFPGKPYRVESRCCWYTISPDGEPMIGWLPKFEGRVLIAHNCAGGGVKSAPAAAHILGCLADGQQPSIDTKLFSPARFS